MPCNHNGRLHVEGPAVGTSGKKFPRRISLLTWYFPRDPLARARRLSWTVIFSFGLHLVVVPPTLLYFFARRGAAGSSVIPVELPRHRVRLVMPDLSASGETKDPSAARVDPQPPPPSPQPETQGPPRSLGTGLGSDSALGGGEGGLGLQVAAFTPQMTPPEYLGGCDLWGWWKGAGDRGYFTGRCVISLSGSTENCTITELSVPKPELALATLKGCRWKPALLAGQPLPVRMNLRIEGNPDGPMR